MVERRLHSVKHHQTVRAVPGYKTVMMNIGSMNGAMFRPNKNRASQQASQSLIGIKFSRQVVLGQCML